MKGHLGAVILLLAAHCAFTQQRDSGGFNTQALALVATHQLGEMKLRPKRICLSMPNYKDPPASLLKQISRRDLHILPGSACWKPPQGFLLLVNNYRRTDPNSVEIQMEVDDMNLNGAHVVTRLREAFYTLRSEGQNWRIESYKAKDL